MATPLRQFERPTGWLGHLAGLLMSVSNRPLNAWAVSLLDVRPEDRVLEIGFGPGVALQDVLGRARHGHVAGIDVSTVMIRQARRRNAEAIRQGRLELREGSVARLPYPDGAFDKALAVDAVQAWPDTVGGLTEVRRVLRDGGLFVVTQEPRWARSHAEVERIRDRLVEQMRAAGFQQVRSEARRLRPVLAFSILGTK